MSLANVCISWMLSTHFFSYTVEDKQWNFKTKRPKYTSIQMYSFDKLMSLYLFMKQVHMSVMAENVFWIWLNLNFQYWIQFGFSHRKNETKNIYQKSHLILKNNFLKLLIKQFLKYFISMYAVIVFLFKIKKKKIIY